MTGSSGSSPSSPTTKPEPRYHQCCCYTNSGLSGSSCPSDPLPMPHRRTGEKDLQTTWRNYVSSHTRNLNAFYRILLILLLILTYYVVSNEMKRTTSNSIRSAWPWHISAPILCMACPFTQFTISLSISSVSIFTAVPFPS